MGENSAIQWTTHTFNPWIGCQKVSEGCDHCYAHDNRFVVIQRSAGRELWGNRLRSERHVTSDANWRKPLAWNRAAEAAGERARVFCASLADVFEDRPELVEPRERLWDLIEDTPWLDWQLLTKRPENAVWMKPAGWRSYLRNVWIGTSAENQVRWDERIPYLLKVPAYTVFVSAEPLIGPIECGDALEGIEWLIVGGESGPKARPFDVGWARSLIRQCRARGTAPFVKQLGANPYEERPAEGRPQGTDYALAHAGELHPQHSWFDMDWCLTHTPDGRSAWIRNHRLKDSHGGDWSEWPADLRVREMPASPAALRPIPTDSDLEASGQLTFGEPTP